MEELVRALRGALVTRFGDGVSAFRVQEMSEGDRPWLAVRFVLYDYWVIVFTYDRGAFGFGIDHGGVAVRLLGSHELRTSAIDDLPSVLEALDERVRLRIPDKYLDRFGGSGTVAVVSAAGAPDTLGVMSDVKSVPTARVREVVEVFERVEWPTERGALTPLVLPLGWTVDADRARGVDFATGYDIDSPRASALIVDGAVGQVNIDLTDRIRDADAVQNRAFADVARRLRDELVAQLGPPAREKSGDDARYTWDLDNGGRVAIAKLDRVVQLIVLQKRYAEIERAEERLG
ncbi:DUF6301 family protein [Microbacterium radiodurans]|uniref:Uncharacterized protein n=1 Tax=Microbacterium radiodurans TaxID=661398 RepID=A0A5J5IPL1_9MICO|nr:DUF6301 family protein [Microbacterium radiodurans]KAA9085118.1 hypothetical protein F6B42_11485 [Microbacterium radiodurans]